MYATERIKRTIQIIFPFMISFSLLIVAVSCGGYDTRQKKKEVSGEDVQEEFKEAVDTTAAFLTEEKNAVLNDYMDRIEAAEGQIEVLRENLMGVRESMRGEYRQRIRTLETRVSDTRQKIEDLKTSSEDAWAEMKDGVETALADLDKAIREAREEFSD